MRLRIQKAYRPGDLPPEGYLEWHEWAEVQRKAGIKQVKCCKCGLWRTPQELSAETVVVDAENKRGQIVSRREPVCSKCNTNQ